MTRTCKICLILIVQVWLSGFVSANLMAQVLDSKHSFRFNDINIEAAIDSLRKSIDYGISFNPDGFPKEYKISATFYNQELRTILDSMLSPIKYTFKLVGNSIAILPRDASSLTESQNHTIGEMDTARVIRLSGRVIDRKEKSPVAYASIYIRNRNISTLSNDNGDFIIKLPKGSERDTIYFSCLGYKLKLMRIGDMHPDENIILLDVNTIQLKEVKVKPINPKDVLKKMIDNIPNNYSRLPLMLISFYRETIQQNGDYVGLSEAVLRIYKAAYNSYLNDQVTIYKARKTRFVKQMDTVIFKFQGGIYTSLMLDIAKNPSNFISDEYIEYYDFSLDDIIQIDGRTTYVIAFDQKDISPYPLYKGKLYIDMDTHALVRADFMISPKGLDKAADMLVRKSSRKLKVKPTFSSYVVNYTLQKSTWYLNYIHEEVEFKVKKKYSLFSTTFRSKAEMVITETDSTNAEHIKMSKQVKQNDIFVEKLGTYDPEFWGDFNITKPDESLQEAIQKIRGKLPKNK